MSKNHYIIPIFVPHEGCPHNCVFCNQNSITGNIHDNHQVDTHFVISTIEQYLKTINNKNAIIEVSFFGGTFTAIDIKKQRELLKVAKEYKDKGLINYIRLSTRPDYIDDFILNNLKEFSVDIIELGIQSLDDSVLKLSGRGHSVEDVVKASKLIKDYGFVLGHQVMLGLPGDNFHKDINTALLSVEMKPEICRIYPALVIKNTPMEKMFEDKIYSPYTFQEAIQVAKYIYIIYRANNVNVIRVGLQPTEDINVGKEIVAGPFHPSFREIVESSIINDMILSSLNKIDFKDVKLFINSRDISKLYAYKKYFFNDMKKQIPSKNILVFQDENIKRNQLVLQYDDKCMNLSFDEYIYNRYKEGKLTQI